MSGASPPKILDERLRFYTEAIRLKPTDLGIAYNNRGIARQAKGDIEGANKDFEQAKRLKASAGA